MSSKVQQQCAVCAWRETCSKKFTIKQSGLNCPDFTRDETLKNDSGRPEPSERHKKVEDVFGDG